MKTDDSYALFYDTVFRGSDENDIEFYIEQAKKSGGPVLELACGTGRVLIPMAEAGIDVVGLDLSSAMLAIAREKVEKLDSAARNRIELIEGDMRQLDLGRKFPLVIIPYRAFLAVKSPEDQRATLRRIYDHLEEDGRLIIAIFDPRLDVIMAHSGPAGGKLSKLRETIHPHTGNRVIMWECTRHDIETRTIDVDFIFEEIGSDGNVLSKLYSSISICWIYRQEMQYLLELTGFEIEALYGDFRGGPFRCGGEQVWIAKKPAR